MKFVIPIALAFFTSIALSQQPDADLSKLKEAYSNAIERATAPITSTYQTELKKLLDRLTKEGKLDAALQVRAELEALTGETKDTPTPPANETGRLTRGETKVIEDRIINKYWARPDGTDGYYFLKDGNGHRVMGTADNPILWKIDESGTVVVNRAGGTKFIRILTESTGELRVSAGAAPAPIIVAEPPRPMPPKK